MDRSEIAYAVGIAKALAQLAPKAKQRDRKKAEDDNSSILVRDEDVLRASAKLFLDGHYAQAVEEAFKCVNNTVRNRACHSGDGSGMMKHVFSAEKPVLRLNDLRTQSDRNEQLGYMEIFAGVMTGVRNPRAHAHQFGDTREDALELLVLAGHLARKAKNAKRVVKRKR